MPVLYRGSAVRKGYAKTMYVLLPTKVVLGDAAASVVTLTLALLLLGSTAAHQRERLFPTWHQPCCTAPNRNTSLLSDSYVRHS